MPHSHNDSLESRSAHSRVHRSLRANNMCNPQRVRHRTPRLAHIKASASLRLGEDLTSSNQDQTAATLSLRDNREGVKNRYTHERSKSSTGPCTNRCPKSQNFLWKQPTSELFRSYLSGTFHTFAQCSHDFRRAEARAQHHHHGHEQQ